MSIAALITHGIGPGGSVLYLLTGGLDLGEAQPEPEVSAQQPGGFLPYRKGERRKRGLEWDRRKPIEALVDEAYARLTGDLADATEELAPAIREAVEPFSASSDAPIPPRAAIDFAALAASVKNAQALLAAYAEAQRIKAEMDEEEDVLMSLLMA